MEDKNCELLFEYLRSILYDSKAKFFDPKRLDEPYQKLGKGLVFLDHAVQEMKEYSEALSRGELSVKAPDRDNFLCENLKNIHSNLNHLTWQAKQVAKGDYSQTVSFLGEFSEAFNTMTSQLKEREEALKQEAEREKLHANMMENYNQLLMELIARSDEGVMVISAPEQKILYSNGSTRTQISGEEIYELCLQQQKKQEQVMAQNNDTREWTWEAKDSRNHYFRITSGIMLWHGQRAFVHIIREITKEKLRQNKLETEAYKDSLTGIGNRLYFFEKAAKILESGVGAVLCYCDLDHLKYVNDNLGHSEGDWYLRNFADTVRQKIRHGDIFARIGGDEFCILLLHCRLEGATGKMQSIQKLFADGKEHSYAKSFSFGLEEITAGHDPLDLEQLLSRADQKMYRQKKGLG